LHCHSQNMKLIMIDFDDTISCSSWLTKIIIANNISDEESFIALKEDIKGKIASLESKVLSLLDLSKQKGKTIIVSNAEYDWISYVMSNFSPVLQDFICRHEIEIVSARDLFQSEYPNDPIKWKVECFRQQIGMYMKDDKFPSDLMVVSIGDGLFERIACKTICDEFKVNSCSLKLFELPNPTVLSNEIDLIIQCFNELLEIPKDFWSDNGKLLFYCNDLYFDYNSDGFLCIFHWEKRDSDKSIEASDVSCTECLHNGELQDQIVKNHHVDLDNNPSLPLLSQFEPTSSSTQFLSSDADEMNNQTADIDLSNTFIPISSEVLSPELFPITPSIHDSSSLIKSNAPQESAISTTSTRHRSVHSTSSNNSTYFFEDNGSTSGESNLEDDEYLSLLHADPSYSSNNLSSAYGEMSISFRSDGNQSRNSDNNSDLSDASVMAYNNISNATNLRSPLPDLSNHKNNYSNNLAMQLFDEKSELVGEMVDIQADHEVQNN